MWPLHLAYGVFKALVNEICVSTTFWNYCTKNLQKLLFRVFFKQIIIVIIFLNNKVFSEIEIFNPERFSSQILNKTLWLCVFFNKVIVINIFQNNKVFSEIQLINPERFFQINSI